MNVPVVAILMLGVITANVDCVILEKVSKTLVGSAGANTTALLPTDTAVASGV